MSELNAKQKRFVAEYLIDSNATQAAIRAGYSAKTAKQIGSRLLTNVDVLAEVNSKQAKIADRLEFTAADLLRDARQIGKDAWAAEAFPSALKSLEMLGNALPDGNPFEGTLKVKVEAPDSNPLDHARAIAFAFALAGKATPPHPEAPPTKH